MGLYDLQNVIHFQKHLARRMELQDYIRDF